MVAIRVTALILLLGCVGCASNFSGTLRELPDGTIEFKGESNRSIEIAIEKGDMKGSASTKGKGPFEKMVTLGQLVERD